MKRLSNEDLQNIYTLGVVRTLWKSTIPSKLNQLRESLDLPARTKPLGKNQYDGEVFTVLYKVDFSPLDKGWCSNSNIIKYTVLNFAGCGFKAVDGELAADVMLMGHEE